eukprot:UN13205
MILISHFIISENFGEVIIKNNKKIVFKRRNLLKKRENRREKQNNVSVYPTKKRTKMFQTTELVKEPTNIIKKKEGEGEKCVFFPPRTKIKLYKT